MKVEDIDAVINEVDFNKDGQINYTEFLSATLNVKDFLRPERRKSKLAVIFNQLDTN